ncbi:MAG: ATP-binding protein [Planctomycetota bacterium]
MNEFRFSMVDGPPPDCPGKIVEREIPSDLALVAPLVIRTVEALAEKGVLQRGDEHSVCLCLEEALRNAVLHGNRQEFSKRVRLVAFSEGSDLGFLVSDEGGGFDPTSLRSPVRTERLVEETGRGVFLICSFMDRVAYYRGGSALLMTRRL